MEGSVGPFIGVFILFLVLIYLAAGWFSSGKKKK